MCARYARQGITVQGGVGPWTPSAFAQPRGLAIGLGHWAQAWARSGLGSAWALFQAGLGLGLGLLAKTCGKNCATKKISVAKFSHNFEISGKNQNSGGKFSHSWPNQW